jgi:hypothetical protein
MDDQTAQFLPFHAVNEFMRNDYRLEVIRNTLGALAALPDGFRIPIDQLTRSIVQVPGFRNSAKAPLGKRVKPTAEAFENNSHMAAAILSAWAEAHPDLRQQVYDLLVERQWEVLPPEADRTQLPGFMITWPKGEDFEQLIKAFIEKYPVAGVNHDDVSLMVVWISVRLPYQFEDDEEENELQLKIAGCHLIR